MLRYIAIVLTAMTALAQEPATGLFYYALEDRDAGVVVRRGVAGGAGVAFDQLIVADNTHYRLWLLEASTLRVTDSSFQTGDSGTRLALPSLELRRGNALDSDFDGLPEIAEHILGTDPNDPDSDGDGVNDGPEVTQGTDPLDGIAARTGLIAAVNTDGTAVDIGSNNNLVVIADTTDIVVFNVFNGLSPTIVARVTTPGTAQRVAVGTMHVAVADGNAGLAIIDVSDPPQAFITHQLPMTATVQAVAVAGAVAFAGTNDGQVAKFDIATGLRLSALTIDGPVQDLVVNGDHLFILSDEKLFSVDISGFAFAAGTGVVSPFDAGVNVRLAVGDDVAYAVHGKGYNTFDITTPAAPVLDTAGTSNEFGWKQLVLNGSGIGIAAAAPNSTFDGPHDVRVYDVSDAGVTNNLLATFQTPGVARAVTIFNGIAYVADHESGLAVVNYLAYDTLATPPVISLTGNFDLVTAEEGKQLRVTATVTDDVQVRNVEFYIDGELVVTDGNFPFEHQFTSPLTADQASFTLRARASDTGGNSTWTEEVTVNLVADATAPQVQGTVPPVDGLVGGVTAVAVVFSEPLVPESLGGAFTLVSAGPDGIIDNGDDVPIASTGSSFDSAINTAYFNLATALSPGVYRATVADTVEDPVGLTPAAPFTWTFTVLSDNPIPSGVNKVWIGGANGAAADWNRADNWLPNGTPDFNTAVFIPSQSTTMPVVDFSVDVGDLFIDNGASIEVNATLAVWGDVSSDGSTSGTGTVVMSLGNTTLRGTLGNLRVDQGVGLIGDTQLGVLTLRNSGQLTVNEYTLAVTGDLRLDDGAAELVMTMPGDRVQVGGSIHFNGSANTGWLTDGVLEVAGDFIEGDSGFSFPRFLATGNHTVRLNGTSAQQITVTSGTHFVNLIVDNAAGVVSSTGFRVDGDATIVTGTVAGSGTAELHGDLTADAAGWMIAHTRFTANTLQMPAALNSNVTFAATTTLPGALDIVGNLILNAGVTLSGATTVSGDVSILSGNAELVINGQNLQVGGDLVINDFAAQLVMQNPADLVQVTGSASFDGTGTSGLLTDGVLEIGGNLTEGSQEFSGARLIASDNHTIVLNGTTEQHVNIRSATESARVNHLQINNAAGVVFDAHTRADGDVTVTSGVVSGNTVKVGGDLVTAPANWQASGTELSGNNIQMPTMFSAPLTLSGITTVPAGLNVTSDLTVLGQVTLDGNATVTGSVLLSESATTQSLTINGHTLDVDGDLLLTSAHGKLLMQNAADRVNVTGNAQFNGSADDGLLNAGILSIAGDFTTGGVFSFARFKATGSHRVVFNGDQQQTVDIQHTSVFFNDLEIQNNVSLAADTPVNGQLIVNNTGDVTIAGSGQTLTVGGVDADELVLDNVLLSIGTGTVTKFDSITFRNQADSATQLTISHPNLNTTFTDLVFESVPVSGLYIHATDFDNQAPVATLTLVNPTPAAPGDRTQTNNGFVLNW